MRRIFPLLLCLLFALPTAGGAEEVQRWDSKIEQKLKDHEVKELEAQERLQAIENKRIAEIESNGWPYEIEYAVIKRQIILGMTKEQVLASRGEPARKHRSVFKHGVHEQWVYGRTYLHFEDGVLTSWSD